MRLHAVKQLGVIFNAILVVVWSAVFVQKTRSQQTVRPNLSVTQAILSQVPVF